MFQEDFRNWAQQYIKSLILNGNTARGSDAMLFQQFLGKPSRPQAIQHVGAPIHCSSVLDSLEPSIL